MCRFMDLGSYAKSRKWGFILAIDFSTRKNNTHRGIVEIKVRSRSVGIAERGALYRSAYATKSPLPGFNFMFFSIFAALFYDQSPD